MVKIVNIFIFYVIIPKQMLEISESFKGTMMYCIGINQ